MLKVEYIKNHTVSYKNTLLYALWFHILRSKIYGMHLYLSAVAML
jgi:hypothetical protein